MAYSAGWTDVQFLMNFFAYFFLFKFGVIFYYFCWLEKKFSGMGIIYCDTTKYPCGHLNFLLSVSDKKPNWTLLILVCIGIRWYQSLVEWHFFSLELRKYTHTHRYIYIYVGKFLFPLGLEPRTSHKPSHKHSWPQGLELRKYTGALKSINNILDNDFFLTCAGVLQWSY